MILHNFERISQVLTCVTCYGVLAFGVPQTSVKQSTTDTPLNVQTNSKPDIAIWRDDGVSPE